MMRSRAQARSFSGFVGANGGVPAAPVNTVAPVITGTMTVGQTVATTGGTWTGKATPTKTYQWRRNGTPISGATGSSYVLVQADSGTTITVAVTGTNWTSAVTAISAGRAVA